MRTTARQLTMPALLLVGALALTACGGSNHPAGAMAGSHAMSSTTDPSATPGASGAPAGGAHNAADSAFAAGMIPHHGQAVEMADLALAKAGNAEVRKLATAVKAAQSPEIAQMGGWLSGWGEPVPAATGHTMAMEGMMSMEDMHALAGASGPDFDRMWVRMMITHHQGALAMSQKQLTAGQNPEVKKLAAAIIAGQTREIASMKALLAQLPA